MNLTWERAESTNGYFAQSGKLTVGHIVARHDGVVAWQITAVHMRYVAKGSGETNSIANARRSLSRAWDKWLAEAGLTPV